MSSKHESCILVLYYVARFLSFLFVPALAMSVVNDRSLSTFKKFRTNLYILHISSFIKRELLHHALILRAVETGARFPVTE